MDLTVVRNVVTSKVARQILITKKHAPAILFASGVAGFVATTVTACQATLKMDDLLKRAENERFKVETLEHVQYSDKDRKKDLALLRLTLARDVTKLYAPTVVLGAATIAAFTGSHVILNRRNVAITAAYKAVEKGFNEYRDRVKEELGEERELELRRNVREETMLHDHAKGEVHTRKVVGPGGISKYARLYDRDTTDEWQEQPEYNIAFIKCQERYANQRLQAKGHVLLNDVYDALGLARTKEGCVVGWVKGHGDDYIDFGLFRRDNGEEIINFMSGREGAIWLDFNVDGLVYDLI